MSEHSAQNGTPIPTRRRYAFKVISGGYACAGCGCLVGGRITDVRQHEAWHDLLTSVTSPGQTAEKDAHRSRLVTHYLAPVGALIHALPDGFGACNASRDPAKVDCDVCLSIIGPTRVTPPE